MTLSVTVPALIEALIGVVAAAVGYVAWGHRDKPGGMPLFVMTSAAALYAVTSALASSLTAPAAWQVAESLLYPLTAAIGAGALYLGVDFTGRDITGYPWVIALLVGQVLIGGVFAVTAPAHSLFVAEYTARATVPTTTTYGPLFWVNTLVSLVVILASITLLTVELAKSEGLYREQAATVVVSGVLGTGFFLWEVVAPIHPTFNLATVGVVGWCLAILWGVFRFDLLETSPVAEEALIDSIDAAVLAIDADSKVVDVNAGAERLLGVGPDAIGSPASEALEGSPEVVDAITDGQRDAEVTVGDDRRTFEVEVSPVYRTYSRPGPIGDQRRRAGRTVLIEDVTERKRRERRLERQNERLEEFASVVSHDLRNPLNVAAGQVELARMEAEGETDHLESAARAHKRMETLIEDLLTLARGERSVTAEPVDLAAVLRECWAATETADATLDIRTEQTIAADRTRLRQLIENLMRNAVEHAGADAVVTVGELPDGFYVADDGPGIPPGERDRIFESGRSLAADGTGLGLAIVRQIAADHGWDVVATAADGGGARFEITGVDAVE